MLGNGIHSITGLKKPIQILSKFGHSCSYNKVQKIETAQAEVVQQMASTNFPLPLLPKNDNEKASTNFGGIILIAKKKTSQEVYTLRMV